MNSEEIHWVRGLMEVVRTRWFK